MYVQVSPHTICNLNCDFCLRSVEKPAIERIEYSDFEDVISKLYYQKIIDIQEI